MCVIIVIRLFPWVVRMVAAHCEQFMDVSLSSALTSVPSAGRLRSRRGRQRCRRSPTRRGARCPARESARACPVESRVRPAVWPVRTARARPNATRGTRSRRGRAPTTRSCTAATSSSDEAPAATEKHLYIRHPPMRLSERSRDSCARRPLWVARLCSERRL